MATVISAQRGGLPRGSVRRAKGSSLPPVCGACTAVCVRQLCGQSPLCSTWNPVLRTHTQTHTIYTRHAHTCAHAHTTHAHTHTHTHTFGFRLYHSAAPRPAAWGIGGRGFRMASKVARTGQYYLFLLFCLRMQIPLQEVLFFDEMASEEF